MSVSTTSTSVILNFNWQGPTRSQTNPQIKVVDLVFKNAKNLIRVAIPENNPSSVIQKLPFTCRGMEETYFLHVTQEQMRDLTLKARFFEPKSSARSDREITVEIPEGLKVGQTYQLLISSSDALSLSARLLHSDLDLLSVDELQSRLENAMIEDLELERQSYRPFFRPHQKELNELLERKRANRQLRTELHEALRRQGVETPITDSPRIRSAQRAAEQARVEELTRVPDPCTQQ